jgi:hypothetical protein
MLDLQNCQVTPAKAGEPSQNKKSSSIPLQRISECASRAVAPAEALYLNTLLTPGILEQVIPNKDQ